MKSTKLCAKQSDSVIFEHCLFYGSPMSKILLLSFLTITALSTLFRPWIGIAAYYFLGILGPQHIWFWSFEGLRSSLVVVVFVQISIFIKIFFGKINFELIKPRQNICIFFLLVFVILSYFFGAYASEQTNYYSPQEQVVKSIKIFLIYFCAILLISDIKKLQDFSLIIVIITVFFIGWSNSQYFSANWSQFNYGRLMGPNIGGAIYGDENAFGMLFVSGLPFCYYIGKNIKYRWVCYALWATIPLGLHAIFLTGSRGALLGLTSSIFAGIITSKRKIYALLLLPALAFFFFWQGGAVMKDRTKTIVSYEGESSAESRLDAWIAGGKMIIDHPLFGVGVGTFMTAMEDYSELQPIIAHNTVIHYTAESGIGAGLCYILIAFTVLKNLSTIIKDPATKDTSRSSKSMHNISLACISSFTGFLTCSIFLSLMYYEIYFYLLVISNTAVNLHKISKMHKNVIQN